MTRFKTLFPMVGLLMVGAAVQAAEDSLTVQAGDGVDRVVRAFFEEHCLRCHGPSKAKGELRLDQLDADLATPLEAVRDKMSTRLYNALQWNAPHTGNGPVLLAHVVACDEPFWFRAPNLGRTTMNELKSFLRDNNLPKLGTLPIKKEY